MTKKKIATAKIDETVKSFESATESTNLEPIQFGTLEETIAALGGKFPATLFVSLGSSSAQVTVTGKNDDGTYTTDQTITDGEVTQPAVINAGFAKRPVFSIVDPNDQKSSLELLNAKVQIVNAALVNTAQLAAQYGKFLRLENNLGLPETAIDLSGLKLVVEERSGSFKTAGELLVVVGPKESTIGQQKIRTRELAGALSQLTKRGLSEVNIGGLTFFATRDGLLLNSDVILALTWKEADEILEYASSTITAQKTQTVVVGDASTAKREGQ